MPVSTGMEGDSLGLAWFGLGTSVDLCLMSQSGLLSWRVDSLVSRFTRISQFLLPMVWVGGLMGIVCSVLLCSEQYARLNFRLLRLLFLPYLVRPN